MSIFKRFLLLVSGIRVSVIRYFPHLESVHVMPEVEVRLQIGFNLVWFLLEETDVLDHLEFYTVSMIKGQQSHVSTSLLLL